MPKLEEFAELVVRGSRYTGWESVSVSRNGIQSFSEFLFTAASPIESAPNFVGQKLRIGDRVEVYLAGQLALTGEIRTKQAVFDAKNHGLQLGGRSKAAVTGRATVNHERGEYKGYSLSQIANGLLQPFGISFYLKGSTEGAEKVFDKFCVQAGETVFSPIERMCRMRNIYIFDDKLGNIVGYRGGTAAGSAIADLEEGRNILSCSASFDFEGAFSEVKAIGQRPGTDAHWADDARDVSGMVQNADVREHVPLILMAEQPGDAADMKMRAQRENGENAAQLIDIQVKVVGWQHADGQLWLDKVGDIVSMYSPLALTDDRMNLAIQSVTSSQSDPTGTITVLGLVHPDRYNGGGQVGATATVFGGRGV